MILALEVAQECPWHQGGGISVAKSCWAPPLSSPGSPLVVQGTEMGKAVLLGTDGLPSIALLMSNANWFRKHRENELDILLFFTKILEVQTNFKNLKILKIWNFIPFIDENFILCQGLFFLHINLGLPNNSSRAVYREQCQCAEISVCQECPLLFRT